LRFLPSNGRLYQTGNGNNGAKEGAMLRSVYTMMGYSIVATDGEAGKVFDVLFDDKIWSTAYLVASVGGILGKKKVLLPPTTLGQPDLKTKAFPVAYSKDQVNSSLEVSLEKPFLKRDEVPLHVDPEWSRTSPPSSSPLEDDGPARSSSQSDARQPSLEADDPHLRSAKEILRCRIQAIDGIVGHVGDLLADDVSWAIRYIVIHTPSSLHHKRILISPLWVRSIAWPEETVKVDFTTQMMMKSL
jgi:hypothetical protein